MNEQYPVINRSILQDILFEKLNKDGNRLFVKRDDLIHTDISGNKWRKLKFNLLKVKSDGQDGILTFGGAYSNHLIATAVAARMNGLKSVGIVRGEELSINSNETLKACSDSGMELVFVSRDEYDYRNERWYQEKLAIRFPNMLIVPEGGAGYLGMIGCQELITELGAKFDIVVVAQGTSTTAAGLLLGLPEDKILWGVPVLKGYNGAEEIEALYRNAGIDREMTREVLSKYVQLDQYHFGGYAKYTAELLDLIELFWKEYHLPLDPVYTAKAMFALVQEVEKQGLKNKTFVFIHTGGLQGAKPIFEKEKRDIF